MILNQINNQGTVVSERFADCIDITIEDSGDYTLNLKPANQETKVMCICFEDATVDDFTLSLTGDMVHQSVVMNGKESHLRLHSQGNQWRVVGSRHTNITN